MHANFPRGTYRRWLPCQPSWDLCAPPAALRGVPNICNDPVTMANGAADETQVAALPDSSQSRTRRTVGRVGAALVVAAGLYHLLSFLLMCWETVPYRYPLEWMEGGIADVVARVMSGENIYTAPSVEYVPYIYPPAGLQLSTLRLVSVAATLLSITLIYRLLRAEGVARWICATGALFFLATFEHSGCWFHLARIDNLFVCLLLAVTLLLRGPGNARRAVAAGLLLAAAFLTKQTAAISLAPLLAALLWLDPRRAWIAGGTSVLAVFASLVVLHLASDGWSTFFLLRLPRNHGLILSLWRHFWWADLWPHFAFALLLSAVGLGMMAVRDRSRVVFYGAMFVGCAGGAWISRLHLGGYLNVLMPVHACIAVLVALGLDTLRRTAAERRGSGARWFVSAGLPCMALLPFLFVGLPWEGRRPTEADRREGDAYLERISRIDGDIFVWCQRFVQTYAGKRSFGSNMAVGDVIRGGGDPAERLKREIQDAVRDRRFAAIIFSSRPPPWLRGAIANHYDLDETLQREDFVPVIGLPVRPRTIYLPRDRIVEPSGTRRSEE